MLTRSINLESRLKSKRTMFSGSVGNVCINCSDGMGTLVCFMLEDCCTGQVENCDEILSLIPWEQIAQIANRKICRIVEVAGWIYLIPDSNAARNSNNRQKGQLPEELTHHQINFFWSVGRSYSWRDKLLLNT